jgi:uncharacterized damage-inducible protein DinB
MVTHYFAKMIEATIWADNQLFACAEKLTEEQRQHDFMYSMGTLNAQIAHLVGVQYWWFHFLTSGEYHFLEEIHYTSLQNLRPKITETHALLRSYTVRLTPEELERVVKPKFWLAETAPWPVWEVIHQVINHSTDHRAQALTFLHRLGGETFQQDYLFFERSELIE